MRYIACNARTLAGRYLAELPKNLRELIEAGGVEALVQAAGERAMRREREFWLPVLERYKLPEGADIFDQLTLQSYITSLRRRLGIKPTSPRYAHKPVSACASTGSASGSCPHRHLIEIPVRAKRPRPRKPGS